MKTLIELYQDLDQYRAFDKNKNNCVRFLETVDEIVSRKDASSIKIFFKYFENEGEYDWVFEEVMVALEQYDTKDFLTVFFENSDEFISKAFNRSKYIFTVLMNGAQEFEILKEKYKNFHNELFEKLLDAICELSSKHKILIENLRAEKVKPMSVL